MKAEDIYSNIINRYVAPFLTSQGFKRTGGDWFLRWDGDCLSRTSTDFRKEHGRDEGWVTIHVCVGFQSLADFLGGYSKVYLDDVKRPGAMAADIYRLKPPFHSFAWRFLPDTDENAIGPQIVEDIRLFGLPFFDAYASLDKCLLAWEQGTTHNLGVECDLYVAAAYHLKGQSKQAVELIEERVRQYEQEYDAKRQHSLLGLIRRRKAFLGFLKGKLAAM